MNPLITLSHGTYVGPSGATAPATYSFITRDYQPPAEDRHLDFDIVHNQNGKFKYVYDNGPGFARWPGFTIRCDDNFENVLSANAATQYAHLREMWDYSGVLGLHAPEGVYDVHWAPEAMEKGFVIFPQSATGPIEQDIAVVFEEA